MSMGDTPREDTEISPTARLMWHNEQDILSNAIKPILSRKGKKRARSSSPTASPSQPNAAKAVVDIKELQLELKSPNPDPALDVWDRFALNSSAARTPLGRNNPTLAHLMVSSSPRPTKNGTPRVDSIMRKTISCGPQWTKRRKIEAETRESPTNRPSHGETVEAKSCMVSALLETVNGEISKSDVFQPGQQSLVRSPSPSLGLKKADLRAAATIPVEKADAGPEHIPEPAASSDYGDDDFDDDTLQVLDATLVLTQAEKVRSEANVIELESDTIGESGPGPATALEDEFGDLDDDLFAAAEDLMVQIESRSPSQALPAEQHPQVVTEVKRHGAAAEINDDLFSDDFGDDFDFDAVELAATQSVQVATVVPSLPLTVRTRL